MPRNGANRLAHVAAALQWDRGRWVWLLLIVLGLDLVLGLGDSVGDLLRYDRGAIAAGGWWRLLTAHIVHLDAHHLILNELGLVLMWSLFADDFDAADFIAVVLVVIERLHRGREIDGQHHVDAAFLHLRARIDLLRTRQREQAKEERQVAQGGEPAARLNFAVPREHAEKAETGILDRRRLAPTAAQIGQQGQQKQERQDPGMRELNLVHGPISRFGCSTREPVSWR